MARKFSMRNLMLYGALALTLSTVAWLQSQDQNTDDTVQIVASRSPSRPAGAENPAQAAGHSVTQASSADDPQEAEADEVIDLFSPHAWYVPPPPKAIVAESPPRPTTPPAPFAYMGKMEDTPQGTLIFLSANNKLYSVIKGEMIDHAWRLDSEDANALRLTYIPLNMPQTLSKSAKPALPKPGDTFQNENQGIPG